MRVKAGPIRAKRRKRVLKEASGYYGAKSKLYKKAKEQLLKSGSYSFNDRRKLKNDYRKLWITRINAALSPLGISYSKFIFGLKKAGVKLNRKMISEMAIHNHDEFLKLVEISKKELDKDISKNKN